jgi:hypothetical protein
MATNQEILEKASQEATEDLLKAAELKEELREKVYDRADLRNANEAVALQDMMNNRRLISRLVRKHQDGTLGKPTPEVDAAVDAAEADMGIRIGDEVHNHYPSPPPQPKPEPEPKPQEAKKPLHPLAAAALGAAAMGSVAAILFALNRQEPAKPTDDAATKIRAVQLWEPEDESTD